jgi:hypothetical protein
MDGFLILLENKTNKDKTILELIQLFREEIKDKMDIDVAVAYEFMNNLEDSELDPSLESDISEDEKEKAKNWFLDNFLTNNTEEINKIVKNNSSVIIGFSKNSAGFWERIDVLPIIDYSKNKNRTLYLTENLYDCFECS